MPHSHFEKTKHLLTNRSDLLRILLESEYTRRDLKEQVEFSESTLDRSLRELEDTRLIEYNNGAWRLTYFGRIAIHEHEKFRKHLKDIVAVSRTIDLIPPDSPLSHEFITGCRSINADPEAPDQLLDEVFTKIRHARSIQCVVTKIMVNSIDPFCEAVTATDSYEVELVFSSKSFDILYEYDPKKVSKAVYDEDISIFTGNIPFSFSLWITDERQAGVVIYTETGVRGVILNDTKSAVDWATSQHKQIKRESNQVILRSRPTTVA